MEFVLWEVNGADLLHAVYDVKSLDDRHHLHMSVDLVIVVGN